MMGRLNHDQGQLFYSFRLDEAVPDEHQSATLPVFLIFHGSTLNWRRSIRKWVDLRLIRSSWSGC